jgi:hypothetical protein
MPPLTLPPRSPSTIRAFWLVCSSAVGLAVGVGAAVARRDGKLLALTLPVAAATAAPGLARPLWVELPYRAWNRAGRLVGERSSDWIAQVGYRVVRRTRHLGATHDVPERSPGVSGWYPRSSQPAKTYRYQDVVPADIGRDAFDRYARQPGNEWAEALRPLVRLMSAMETDADVDDTPPPDIYTLY